MGWRLTGSQDVFNGRSPAASVNFLTAHDGFTLRDLVSYDGKHNEANGEDNRDGTDNNRSWNHGVEGPTDDPRVEAGAAAHACAPCSPPCCCRPARRCSSWATSRAHPGRQQQRLQPGQRDLLGRLGPRAPGRRDLLDWTTALLDVRRDHPALRQTEFFDGRPVADGRPADLAWLAPGRHADDRRALARPRAPARW